MSHAWQLQDAKNRFSRLVECAQREGPQVVTKHGKEAVIILSVDDYKKMIKPKINLFKFIQKSPLSGIDLDISRDKNAPRDVTI